MATDGDLWERACARGLVAARDALLVIRPGRVFAIAFGRRVFEGPCDTEPFLPPNGLYHVEAGPGVFALAGLDLPEQAARVVVSIDFVTPPRRIFAIVEQTDPAHGHA